MVHDFYEGVLQHPLLFAFFVAGGAFIGLCLFGTALAEMRTTELLQSLERMKL